MDIQYSEKVDSVIYEANMLEFESVNDWIDLIIACLDQSDIGENVVDEIEVILENSREE